MVKTKVWRNRTISSSNDKTNTVSTIDVAKLNSKKNKKSLINNNLEDIDVNSSISAPTKSQYHVVIKIVYGDMTPSQSTYIGNLCK